MPVTPTPKTIQLDLSEEYFALLDMASRKHNLSHQDIMRQALAMLQDAKSSPAGMKEGIPPLPGGLMSHLRWAHLTAWDRWSESRGQELPLSDTLAAFVDQQVAEGVAREPTGIVMLALLYYARVMDFLPTHEDEES